MRFKFEFNWTYLYDFYIQKMTILVTCAPLGLAQVMQVMRKKRLQQRVTRDSLET